MNAPVMSRCSATAIKRPGAACPDAGRAFEQVLQARGPRRAGTDGMPEERDQTGGEPPPRPVLMGTPATWPGAAVGSSPTSTTATQPQDLGATRAALALASSTPALSDEVAIAGRWEVSIPQALGAPLELQAGRAPGADGCAAWTLDIRSRARHLQSALARSVCRLADRLEARSLSAELRIKEEEEEAP